MEDYSELIRSAHRIAVGLKQVLFHLSSGDCVRAILAKDADRDFRDKVLSACLAARAEVVDAPSRHELGLLAGIAVSAGVVGILR